MILASYEDRAYIQLKGICIGTCVAPVFGNILFSAIDRDLAFVFQIAKVQTLFRYVNDILAILKSSHSSTTTNKVEEILAHFAQRDKGLSFPHELALHNKLQFLV